MILAFLTAISFAPGACVVHDGDSLRCGRERIRLASVDAPELGPCQRGRICTPGDGQASKRALEQMIAGKALHVEPIERDRYGRLVARVSAGGVDLSCRMVAGGFAVQRYRPLVCP